MSVYLFIVPICSASLTSPTFDYSRFLLIKKRIFSYWGAVSNRGTSLYLHNPRIKLETSLVKGVCLMLPTISKTGSLWWRFSLYLLGNGL